MVVAVWATVMTRTRGLATENMDAADIMSRGTTTGTMTVSIWENATHVNVGTSSLHIWGKGAEEALIQGATCAGRHGARLSGCAPFNLMDIIL